MNTIHSPQVRMIRCLSSATQSALIVSSIMHSLFFVESRGSTDCLREDVELTVSAWVVRKEFTVDWFASELKCRIAD